LDPTDEKQILNIAYWYNSEWNTPIERTIQRLGFQPNEDVLFQLILTVDGVLVATGGLCYQVGLLIDHPEFKNYGPWRHANSSSGSLPPSKTNNIACLLPGKTDSVIINLTL
jgi:hypothetical protein